MDIRIDKIMRSKRRSFALQIAEDGDLIVRAPKYASMGAIQRVVNDAQQWIRKKQAFQRERYKVIVSKKFVNGESFLYLGSAYELFITEYADCPLVFDKGFVLSHEYIGEAQKLFTAWYRKQAFLKISERVERYAVISGMEYNKVKITSAKTRWGSCSVVGNLNFTWRLIMAPLEVVDYVVVHELVHIEEKNHGRGFWNKVEMIFPGYGRQRKWLRENGHLLMSF